MSGASDHAGDADSWSHVWLSRVQDGTVFWLNDNQSDLVYFTFSWQYNKSCHDTIYQQKEKKEEI